MDLATGNVMADIFLSYNEKDRPRVRQLAQALERAGWSVWWDRRVPAGLTWRNLLEQELQNMRCMLVLWSANSVKSEWVCEEATEGRLLGRLIPVFLERVRPPAGFREVQAADLVDWDGSTDTIGLQQLLDDIAHKLGAPPGATPAPAPTASDAAFAQTDPKRPRKISPPRVALGLGITLLVAVGGYFSITARQGMGPSKAEEAQRMAEHTDAAIQAKPELGHLVQSSPKPVSSTSSNKVAPATPSPAVTPPVDISTWLLGKPHSVAATPKRTLPARCGAIHERQGMGETPSAEEQAFLNKEC